MILVFQDYLGGPIFPELLGLRLSRSAIPLQISTLLGIQRGECLPTNCATAAAHGCQLTSSTGVVPLMRMRYSEPNALQIRVALAEIDPPVWRRLVVPLSWHLGELHLAIQAAFNWWNSHLHEYRIGGLRYGDTEDGDDGGFADSPRLFDEREVRLSDFGNEPGVALTYTYDFGDNWRHIVEIEKPVALDAAPRLATCVAGARARPPEDVGGFSGYENFLAIMADPSDPEYAETKRWCGGHFDPEWFDLGVTDKDVKNALRTNVRRRLHQPKPRRGQR